MPDDDGRPVTTREVWLPHPDRDNAIVCGDCTTPEELELFRLWLALAGKIVRAVEVDDDEPFDPDELWIA